MTAAGVVQDRAAGGVVPARPFNDFVHDLAFADLSPATVAFAKRCLLDLVGVAAGGATTRLSMLIRNHAAEHFGAGQRRATILFDGRTVSPVGAALAGGMTIDALDAHDGHRLTKGHAGCGVFPAALALAEAEAHDDGRALLTALVIGYEIGTRAGIALHRTASDYHTSGAWVAIACAALGARALGLDPARTREAIGIAEYQGPRSQMMRCIDHPTMVKDGSGWGAMAGVSAAYLAADGFTGAPAITVENAEVADLWSDLGDRWRIFEQYFKPYPVCRWAQPPIEAALGLVRAHGVRPDEIGHVEVRTFHEAWRLQTTRPRSTEAAQYSLPFATAAAIVRGTLGPDEVSSAALADPAILRLSDTMRVVETEAYNAAFPARRFADVTFVMKDGRTLASAPTEARGDPEAHLSDAEILGKFRSIVVPLLGEARAETIRRTVDGLDAGAGVADLVASLAPL